MGKTEKKAPTSTPEKKPTDDGPPPVSFWKLLRYASKIDWLLMIVGGIAAMGNGLALPLFALVFGDMTNALGNGSSPDLMVSLAKSAMLKFFWVGLGALGASGISMGCWMITGERQAIRFREEYFRALLRQEMGWFDKINPSEFTSKIAGECFAIQSGLGEKVSTFIYAISTVIAGFIVGFIKSWQLALVLCSAVPLLGISGTLFVTSLQKQNTQGSKAYAAAGALAEQALSAIRTVVGLGGETKEINAYKAALEAVKSLVIKFGIISAFAFGGIYFANGSNYCIGFWVGGVFVGEQKINPVTDAPYSVGDILTTFFAVTMGAFSISLISPALKAISQAKEAGGKVLSVINRNSAIDHEDKKGEKLSTIKGFISFNDVYFNYPANKEKPVLQGLNLVIEPNQKTAFVGESGCGKSTCMQLIERFYDPNSGSITLDGKPLKELNTKWLRENIGYVGQEPVLFSTSVKENMKLSKPTATDDEIIAALKQANAWDFLAAGKGLETYVGTSGAQMSGGQKQRIAIARAILKNPPILLLDEATSALDRTNEREIQKTLDEMSKGRTTIVIAHRLSTVRNSDKIVLFENGQVSEYGTHDNLIARQGRYYEMQKEQLNPEERNNGRKNSRHAHAPIKAENAIISAAVAEEMFEDLRPSYGEERPSKRSQGAKNQVHAEAEIISNVQYQYQYQNELPNAKTLEVKHVETTEVLLRSPDLDPGSPRSPNSDPQSPKSDDRIVEAKKPLTPQEKKELERKKKEEEKQKQSSLQKTKKT